MFIAPYDMDAPWDTRGVPGTYRFLNRVWNIVQEFIEVGSQIPPASTVTSDILKITHATIKKVTRDIEDEKFNTAVAAMMEMVNALYKIKEADGMAQSAEWTFALESLLQILAPFAPHITEELWAQTADLGAARGEGAAVPRHRAEPWPQLSTLDARRAVPEREKHV